MDRATQLILLCITQARQDPERIRLSYRGLAPHLTAAQANAQLALALWRLEQDGLILRHPAASGTDPPEYELSKHGIAKKEEVAASMQPPFRFTDENLPIRTTDPE